ncbi:MAG TPA: hypothetical protein VF490_03860 [Chryseosolibacter sp.]
MIVALSLLLPVAALVLWIVFIPVYMRVNTDRDQYQIRQAGTVSISFHPWQKPFMTMRVFGIRINIAKAERKKEVAQERKVKKRKTKRSTSAWLYLQRGVLRSMTLKKFICTVDLDDVVMSARLTPLIVFMNRGVVSVSTNFADRNFLCMEVECRLNKLLWTCFRFFTKK